MEPINYDLIFNYGLRMSLTLLLVILLYTIRVLVASIDTVTWYKTNALRLTFAFITVWVLAATLVISPEISSMLGSFGFNAEQSPAAMAFVIGGILIGVTSSPAAVTGTEKI